MIFNYIFHVTDSGLTNDVKSNVNLGSRHDPRNVFLDLHRPSFSTPFNYDRINFLSVAGMFLIDGGDLLT